MTEEGVGEDRCKDRQQPMELGADTIKEAEGKAEAILQMVVLLAEEGDQRLWSDLLPLTRAVSIDSVLLGSTLTTK